MDHFAVIQRLGILDRFVDALNEVADRIVETGNPGAVSVVVSGKLVEKGDIMISFSAAVTEKMPARSARPSLFYKTDGVDLEADDPRQGRLDFFTIGNEPAPAPRRLEEDIPAVRVVGED